MKKPKPHIVAPSASRWRAFGAFILLMGIMGAVAGDGQSAAPALSIPFAMFCFAVASILDAIAALRPDESPIPESPSAASYVPASEVSQGKDFIRYRIET
jgi:hypothetical protein